MNELPKSKVNRKISLFSGNPNSCRVKDGLSSSMQRGILTTGMCDLLDTDSATYPLAVQISSKKSKANSHSEGNFGNSQNQNPILYLSLK